MTKYHWLILAALIGLTIEWHAHYMKGDASIVTFWLIALGIFVYLLIPAP